jgi:repressor LexA
MKGLTKRQLEIFNYIQDFIHSRKYSPSYREIMEHFGFSSVSSVAKHINVLKRKGIVNAEKQCGRSLTLVGSEARQAAHLEIELPFIGHISAGSPIETFPQAQTLAIPAFLVHTPEKTYALRARDDTLGDEMIRDGDLLLVEATHEPLDGETVLASTPQHKTLIKRYHPEGNYVRLASQTPAIEPIIIRHEELSIQGILVGLLRFFN